MSIPYYETERLIKDLQKLVQTATKVLEQKLEEKK